MVLLIHRDKGGIKMKKLLLATDDFIMVTPELFSDLHKVRTEPHNNYIVKADSNNYHMFDTEIRVMSYEDWTKNKGLSKERFKLEVQKNLYDINAELYDIQQKYNHVVDIYLNVSNQVEKWE